LKTNLFRSESANRNGIGEAEFKSLFDTLYEPLRNYIYYKSGDVALAEDVVQETFLKLWEKRQEVKPETVKAYLYKIAGNIFLNNHEHKNVVFNFVNSHKSDEKNVSPEFELEMKEFDEKLQRTLAGLSDKNREVFLMNRIDNLTYNDIATNLGITVKAVEKRMSNALEHLRKHIQYKF